MSFGKFLAAFAIAAWAQGSALGNVPPLVEITPATAAALSTPQATCSVVRTEGSDWLAIRPQAGEATINIGAAPGEWDLSAAEGIRLTWRNPGDTAIAVRAMAAGRDAAGMADTCRAAAQLLPHQQQQMLLRLQRRPVDPTFAPFAPFFMYYKAINVRDNTIDAAHVARLSLSVTGGPALVADIVASGHGDASPAPFEPFIDRYGQYIHADWPGKIHTDADFAQQLDQEHREEAQASAPPGRDQFGGWADGPTLKPTGFFYPAKYSGKWWLIDPQGKLFWSYGVTGVGFGGDVTPVTDRTQWFADLPPQDGPTAAFYRTGHGAAFRYYQDRDWLGLDIQRLNLTRKYGDAWEQAVAALSHVRLHSWGFNTIGNWSSPQVCTLRQTPYTVAIHYPSPMINPRMPDVYDPAWEPAVRTRMQQEHDRTAGDAWNLGYFIDNERWFGWRPRGAAIGEETLKNPTKCAAKQRFVQLLKDKYKTIDALNSAWATRHASWEALQALQQAPDMARPAVLADCGDFGMQFAERYFSVCKSAVKAVAPGNLYLGSRFFGHTDPALLSLAARYCDVVSYNVYDNPPDSRVMQYAKIDAPIISSEWGIGTDPLQTPFREEGFTPTPAQRCAKVAQYLEHALKIPNLVGAHFFQFRDQPTSGRPDGEAMLRGFVNVADTPNFDLVQVSRSVSFSMYERRLEAK